MSVTAEAILAVAPGAAWCVDDLLEQMQDAGIIGPRHASRFLGQIYVESGGFRRVEESLNYAADSAMMRRFIRWGRISSADAQTFGRTSAHPAHENALANILYGGVWGREHLGNTQPGDGWRFRGRGLKQLTGRDNYRRFSLAWLGTDELLRNPDRVARPDGAVASAVWFWTNKHLNAIADAGSVEDVTRVVNGGTTGLAERVKMTQAFATAFA